MRRFGQIVFDFLISLSALSLLFIFLIALAYNQNQSYVRQTSALLMERTCERLSKMLVDAKVEGDGASHQFYSAFQISLNGSRNAYIGDSYLCILPENLSSQPVRYSGEFTIKNSKGNLEITI